jgi:hypothetical protein
LIIFSIENSFKSKLKINGGIGAHSWDCWEVVNEWDFSENDSEILRPKVH